MLIEKLDPLSLLLLPLGLAYFESEVEDVSYQVCLRHDVVFRRGCLWHILWFRCICMEKWDKYANLKHVHEFSVECLLEHATEVIIVVENFKFVLIDQEGYSNPL